MYIAVVKGGGGGGGGRLPVKDDTPYQRFHHGSANSFSGEIRV